MAVTHLLAAATCVAQSAETTFKFDFGLGKTVPGYIKVLPETVYRPSTVTNSAMDSNQAPH
jgi:hypothetical protein